MKIDPDSIETSRRPARTPNPLKMLRPDIQWTIAREMLTVSPWLFFPQHSAHNLPSSTDVQPNQKNIKKQKAINVPKIIPSLLFLLPILCIKSFTPGNWLAAKVILRLTLAKVSLCIPKFSLIVYAWLIIPSITLWLLSRCPLSCSIYSASCSSALRLDSISARTFASKCCLFLASPIWAINRRNSCRWSVRSSRCRVRLFCLSADVLRADSESNRRDNWERRVSRWLRSEVIVLSREDSSVDGDAGNVDVRYWERVWNWDSVWDSRERICCRSWAQPVGCAISVICRSVDEAVTEEIALRSEVGDD